MNTIEKIYQSTNSAEKGNSLYSVNSAKAMFNKDILEEYQIIIDPRIVRLSEIKKEVAIIKCGLDEISLDIGHAVNREYKLLFIGDTTCTVVFPEGVYVSNTILSEQQSIKVEKGTASYINVIISLNAEKVLPECIITIFENTDEYTDILNNIKQDIININEDVNNISIDQKIAAASITDINAAIKTDIEKIINKDVNILIPTNESNYPTSKAVKDYVTERLKKINTKYIGHFDYFGKKEDIEALILLKNSSALSFDKNDLVFISYIGTYNKDANTWAWVQADSTKLIQCWAIIDTILAMNASGSVYWNESNTEFDIIVDKGQPDEDNLIYNEKAKLTLTTKEIETANGIKIVLNKINLDNISFYDNMTAKQAFDILDGEAVKIKNIAEPTLVNTIGIIKTADLHQLTILESDFVNNTQAVKNIAFEPASSTVSGLMSAADKNNLATNTRNISTCENNITALTHEDVRLAADISRINTSVDNLNSNVSTIQRDFQPLHQKTNMLSESSTHDQYPTAKVVYDAIQAIDNDNISNEVIHTDEQGLKNIVVKQELILNDSLDLELVTHYNEIENGNLSQKSSLIKLEGGLLFKGDDTTTILSSSNLATKTEVATDLEAVRQKLDDDKINVANIFKSGLQKREVVNSISLEEANDASLTITYNKNDIESGLQEVEALIIEGATTLKAGLETAADKVLIDGSFQKSKIPVIDSKQQLVTDVKILEVTESETKMQVGLVDINGAINHKDLVFESATRLLAGLMSSSDKTKLDNVGDTSKLQEEIDTLTTRANESKADIDLHTEGIAELNTIIATKEDSLSDSARIVLSSEITKSLTDKLISLPTQLTWNDIAEKPSLELSENKSSVIDASSTNIQYPTSKSVYDATINTVKTSWGWAVKNAILDETTKDSIVGLQHVYERQHFDPTNTSGSNGNIDYGVIALIPGNNVSIRIGAEDTITDARFNEGDPLPRKVYYIDVPTTDISGKLDKDFAQLSDNKVVNNFVFIPQTNADNGDQVELIVNHLNVATNVISSNSVYIKSSNDIYVKNIINGAALESINFELSDALKVDFRKNRIKVSSNLSITEELENGENYYRINTIEDFDTMIKWDNVPFNFGSDTMKSIIKDVTIESDSLTTNIAFQLYDILGKTDSQSKSIVLEGATSTIAGLMTSVDKAKLDSLENIAEALDNLTNEQIATLTGKLDVSSLTNEQIAAITSRLDISSLTEAQVVNITQRLDVNSFTEAQLNAIASTLDISSLKDAQISAITSRLDISSLNDTQIASITQRIDVDTLTTTQIDALKVLLGI